MSGAPTADLRTSPFDLAETERLLRGIDLESIPLQSDISSAALGGDTFRSGIADVLGAEPLPLKVPGTAVSKYEFSAYLAVVDGSQKDWYYKTDPEIITGKRGGG